MSVCEYIYTHTWASMANVNKPWNLRSAEHSLINTDLKFVLTRHFFLSEVVKLEVSKLKLKLLRF